MPIRNRRDIFRPLHVHVHVVGLNRSLSHTGASIIKRVVEPLRRAPALRMTTSLALIRPEGEVVNIRSGESGQAERNLPAAFEAFPLVHLEQAALEARTLSMQSSLVARGDVFSDGGNSIRFCMVYLSALEESTQLIDGIPDVVISLRPDIEIRGRLWIVIRTLRMALLARLGWPSVLLPAWGNFNGFNDRFAILGGANATTYLTRVNQIWCWTRTVADGQQFDPESFLKFSLTGRRVRKTIYTPMIRVRIGGRTETRDLRFFVQPPVVAKFQNLALRIVGSFRRRFVPSRLA